MKLTIRAQLALWYMLAFAAALLFVLAVLALEMKNQFEEESKAALRTEERWLTGLFESRFLGLLTLQGRAYAVLDSTLHEELEERYGLKRQFALLVVQRQGERAMFRGGLKKAQQLLPNDLWERVAGNYDVQLDNRRYRLRVFHRSWGNVAVGAEAEPPYRMAREAGEVLLWIFPLALALALAGGWIMAKLAMRPVFSAARAAEVVSLMNLRDNAVKYTMHGSIALCLRGGAGMLAFELHDTGLGIPEEELPHIFDRFYRVDKSRTSATGGSGLGLAICKWIVAAHHGEITITSTTRKGTKPICPKPCAQNCNALFRKPLSNAWKASLKANAGLMK